MTLQSSYWKGPPRGKRGGVIRHILERENGNWMEKLRYFVNDQSDIQRDSVNLAWTWILDNFWAWFVRKICVKAGFRAPLRGPKNCSEVSSNYHIWHISKYPKASLRPLQRMSPFLKGCWREMGCRNRDIFSHGNFQATWKTAIYLFT